MNIKMTTPSVCLPTSATTDTAVNIDCNCCLKQVGKIQGAPRTFSLLKHLGMFLVELIKYFQWRKRATFYDA